MYSTKKWKEQKYLNHQFQIVECKSHTHKQWKWKKKKNYRQRRVKENSNLVVCVCWFYILKCMNSVQKKKTRYLFDEKKIPSDEQQQKKKSSRDDWNQIGWVDRRGDASEIGSSEWFISFRTQVDCSSPGILIQASEGGEIRIGVWILGGQAWAWTESLGGLVILRWLTAFWRASGVWSLSWLWIQPREELIELELPRE